MKKLMQRFSPLMLAITMAASIMAVPVAAEEAEQPAPVAASAVQQEAEPTPEPTAEPTPEPVQSDIQVQNYSVELLDGQDSLWNWLEGGHITVHLIGAEDATVARVVNNEPFTNYGPVEAPVEQGTVVFNNIQYNGNGNTFTFEVVTPNGVVQQSVVIAQCLDENPRPETEAPTPTEEPQADYPKVLVKDFSFGGTSVTAGQEFELVLTLMTTSGDTSLQDVMVGLNLGDAKNISLASGSMNTYVGTMAPNTTQTIRYKMLTDATIEPGSVSITVDVTSKEGEPSNSPISIPVIQPERFEITGMEAPETMMLGEEGYLAVVFVNKGKSVINNLSAEIQGDNLANPGQSQFLGNIQPGTENSVDFSVIAEQEGNINGKVILTYEDAKGNQKTLEKEFSCMVEPGMDMMDPGMMDPGMMDDVYMEFEPEPAIPGGVWVLIALVVVAVVVAVVLVLRRRAKTKALAQLEEDEDDEDI